MRPTKSSHPVLPFTFLPPLHNLYRFGNGHLFVPCQGFEQPWHTVSLIEFQPRRIYYTGFNARTITIVEAGASMLGVSL
jgi:hypothetical protein